jgi:hypothetical protein
MSNRTLGVFCTLALAFLCPLCRASTFTASVSGVSSNGSYFANQPNAVTWGGHLAAGSGIASAFGQPSELTDDVEVQSISYDSHSSSLSATSSFNLDGFSITGPPGQIPVSLTVEIKFTINEGQDLTSQYTDTPWSASITASSSLQDSLTSNSQNLGTFTLGTNNLVISSTGGFSGLPPGTIYQPFQSEVDSQLEATVFITTPAILYNVGDPTLTMGATLSVSATAGGPLYLHDVHVISLLQPLHINPLNLPPGYVANAPQNMIVDNIYLPEPSTLVLAALGFAALAGWRLRRRSPAR